MQECFFLPYSIIVNEPPSTIWFFTLNKKHTSQTSSARKKLITQYPAKHDPAKYIKVINSHLSPSSYHYPPAAISSTYILKT